MSLSDEERRNGLFYAVHRIYERGKALRKKNHYPPVEDLAGLCMQVWHAFLGKDSNGLHWFAGSSATNKIGRNGLSAWTVPILSRTKFVLKSKEDKDWHAALEKKEGYCPTIESLLRSQDPVAADIYEAYAWTEQAVYSLRRYDDEFLERLEPLSQLISQIQGECFGLFDSDDIYAKAYILADICSLLYGPLYPYQREKWDVVTKWLDKECLHHDLNRPMRWKGRGESLEWLATIHKKLLTAKNQGKLTFTLRILTAMEIAGTHFHYDNQFVDLYNLIKETKASVDMPKIQQYFRRCQKAKKLQDAEHEASVDEELKREALDIYD